MEVIQDKQYWKRRPMSEETKLRISQSKKDSIPWNKGLKGWNSGELNPFYGKHHSQESIQKANESRAWYTNSDKAKEVAKKMSQGNMGKKRTAECCKRMSETRKGEKRSEEAKQKMREAKLKLWQNPEYKQRMIDAHKGFKPTEETLQKLKGKTPWNKGMPQSDEAKLKNRDSHIILAQNPEYKKRMSELHKRLWEELTPEQKNERIKHQLKSLLKRPTSYEQQLSELFIKHKLPFLYTGNGKFLINFKNPDFVNHETRTVIEVYHNYFKLREYGSIENYQAFCKNKYEPAGWKVVFIDENDLNRNDWEQYCLNKLNINIQEEVKVTNV